MIEVRSIHDVSDENLADMLNSGWSVMHIQIMPRHAFDEDDRLHVVLQRTINVTPPQPNDNDSIPLSKRLESDDLESDFEDSLWDDEDESPSTYFCEDEDEDEDEDRAFGFDGSDIVIVKPPAPKPPRPPINPDEIPF